MMRPMPPSAAAMVSCLCRCLCLLLLAPAAGSAGAIGDAGAPATVATPAPPVATGALAAARGSGSGSGSGSDGTHLQALFDREWEMRLRDEPLFATEVGRHEYDALLPEVAYADLERRHRARQALLAELASIDLSQLAVADVVNAQIWRAQLEDRIAEFELGSYQMPFNADSGFHTGFAMLPDRMPFANRRDYENYLSRLRAWPRYVGQQIELMRMGIRRGFTVPRATLTGYERTISAHVVDDPAKSVFYKPFERFPAAMPEAERQALREEARAAILDGAVAGYRLLLDFYRAEYLPHARATIGASELPDGRAYYAHQIRHFTTLDLSPEEIHRIGLAEVERIAGEMQAVIRQVGFEGDFAAFVHFLRTDPRFYPKTGEELLKDAAWIAKRIDGKLPSEFKTLPRLPYTVQPVPDHLAPKYTAGRYVQSPAGSTRPGIYWVNTYQPETRPLYDLEALTLHEAVPGHHLQIALSQELADLPDFRRYSYLSAFGEGWGLYSEWLGLEMGFYTDPYSNFGRLTYEMWRACRLVVDTGIHAQGWTRQQAIDYLAAHTALPLHEIETETDRYISWPGQALAYKLGELKIKELRRKAEKALGPSFDVRQFHDVVLGSGAVPLAVLEQNVDRFIAAQTARPGP
ncbi:MAG TPA: DUF885 domain-containing protein [Thermoanaerobaculia bacterium]|nr:DUF885 domain-containing protein [Thermoanaerobaculia bacterium]